MRVEVPLPTTAQRQALPPEVYVSHVEALFDGIGAFAIGVLGSSATLFVAGWRGVQPQLTWLAVALLGLGLIRLATMVRFSRVRGSLDARSLRRWERWYIVGGTAYLALLGAADLLAFGFGEDPFARLASLVVTMAYLVGTPGRSFASPFLVNTQIVAVCVPVLLGLALAGGVYWWLTFLILIPFFLALKAISTRLNGIFVAATTRAIDLGQLALRFNTALNNIPQGLLMFDGGRRITVVNGRLLELLGAAPEILKEGSTLEDFACAWEAVGPTEILSRILSQHRSDLTESVALMGDGRSISVRLQPMERGGGVLLLEDVTERVRSQAEIVQLARYDSLTGMLNQRAFLSAAKTACQAADGKMALLFVDLDRFKAVNDTLGHAAGDRLIVEVSERLQAAAGASAILGRFGGDEFVVYREFDDGQPTCEAVADAIITALSQPYFIDGQRVTVGASIGIASAARRDGDIDELLRNADLALYRAKVEGRGIFRVFKSEMKTQADWRRRTEEDLRVAIAADQLELHYQPIYSVSEKRFVSCEALLRWRHPTRGLVPPADFIPIAEETGLIREIGIWVIRRACRECLHWPPDISVAVNLSAAQFQQTDITSMVMGALLEANLGAQRLEIEVTESLLLNDLPATNLVLRKMAAMGVKLSLDDFGTGFSSLSYLQSLPFTKVKVDRSFLQGLDENSRAMVLLRGIQRLSAELGMTVVMEGVETPEQLKLVVDHAFIDLVQGYLMARPMPAIDVRRLLSQSFGLAVA